MASDKGITAFDLEDDGESIPVPTKENLQKVREEGEKLGFNSDKVAETPPATEYRTVKKSAFTYAYTLRMRPEDKQRFDDFAYKNRYSKGAAFQALLDLAAKNELL